MLRTGTCQLFSGFKQAFDSAVSLTFRFRRSLLPLGSEFSSDATDPGANLETFPEFRLTRRCGIAAKIAGNPEPLVLELNQSVAFARVEDYL
jgi:hypothetical protein